MAFGSPEQDREELDRMIAQRARVAWVQDLITLSVFHKRPQPEIDTLMEELRAAASLYSKKKES